jgi:hypothetical protein
MSQSEPQPAHRTAIEAASRRVGSAPCAGTAAGASALAGRPVGAALKRGDRIPPPPAMAVRTGALSVAKGRHTEST